MGLIGSALIFLGAAGVLVIWRQESRCRARLGRDMLADLETLRYEICVRRGPLPEILEERLCVRPVTGPLWREMYTALSAGPEAAWDRLVLVAPEPLRDSLAPLGKSMRAGGERLAGAINETREELARRLREESRQDAERARLGTAVCLSAAALLVLVLI